MHTEKINLAIIDDHQLLAESLQKLLTKYEFVQNINIFTGVDEYFEFSFEKAPDIVICDILMKGKSGFDFLNGIKNQTLKQK